MGTFPVEFRDGTGGGDAFDAGFIAGLLEGRDPLTCIVWGSISARHAFVPWVRPKESFIEPNSNASCNNIHLLFIKNES